jgi:hypothetical protein
MLVVSDRVFVMFDILSKRGPPSELIQ